MVELCSVVLSTLVNTSNCKAIDFKKIFSLQALMHESSHVKRDQIDGKRSCFHCIARLKFLKGNLQN